MTYEVIIYEQAQADLAKLAKSEPKAFAKAQRFIEELKEHPKTRYWKARGVERRQEWAMVKGDNEKTQTHL